MHFNRENEVLANIKQQQQHITRHKKRNNLRIGFLKNLT